MSRVLFFSVPAYGHVNPTLGLASELVKHGESIDYSCTPQFRERIEKTGAVYKNYGDFRDENISFAAVNQNTQASIQYMIEMCKQTPSVLRKILDDIGDTKYDYIVKDSAYVLGTLIAKIKKLPVVTSFALFTHPEDNQKYDKTVDYDQLISDKQLLKAYESMREELSGQYGVDIPPIEVMFFDKGNLNIVHTSSYFWDSPHFDDSFVYIGPPVYDRKEDIDFPFDKLKNKKVIYISLGTVYNNHENIYNLFFQAFGNTDYTVVMPAFKINTDHFKIPANFIVRDFVPQSEVLKYASAAITHAGMNTLSDLIWNEVPFVSIPFISDQPVNAQRAQELGASISLFNKELTPELIRDSIETVMTGQSYAAGIRKIADSFRSAGGYEKAVDEIFRLKSTLNI